MINAIDPFKLPQMRCFIVWIQHLSDNLELIMLYLSHQNKKRTKGKDDSHIHKIRKGPYVKISNK